MLEHVLMPGVRLRLFEEVDADELYRLIEDNRAYLAPWMPWAANQTLGDTSEFIRSRLGFKREGVLRQLVQVSGRHQDIAVYSVLAGEWPPAGATR